MVGNQSHKSVKVVYPTAQLCKGTVDEGQPYKLPVGKLKHGHNDKLLEGWERVSPYWRWEVPEVMFLFVGPYSENNRILGNVTHTVAIQ